MALIAAPAVTGIATTLVKAALAAAGTALFNALGASAAQALGDALRSSQTAAATTTQMIAAQNGIVPSVCPAAGSGQLVVVPYDISADELAIMQQMNCEIDCYGKGDIKRQIAAVTDRVRKDQALLKVNGACASIGAPKVAPIKPLACATKQKADVEMIEECMTEAVRRAYQPGRLSFTECQDARNRQLEQLLGHGDALTLDMLKKVQKNSDAQCLHVSEPANRHGLCPSTYDRREDIAYFFERAKIRS